MGRGIFVSLMFLAISLAYADVYKCADSVGKIMYQDQPCTDANTGPLLTTVPVPAPAASRTPTPRAALPGAVLSAEPTDTFTSDECMTLNDVRTQLSDISKYAVEINWKIDVANRCKRTFRVVVHYGMYDKQGYEIARDAEELFVPSRDIGTATGRLRIRPPDKMLHYAESKARITFRTAD